MKIQGVTVLLILCILLGQTGTIAAAGASSSIESSASTECKTLDGGQDDQVATAADGTIEWSNGTVRVHLSRTGNTNRSHRLNFPGRDKITVLETENLNKTSVGYEWPASEQNASIIYEVEGGTHYLTTDEWAYVPLPVPFRHPINYSLGPETSGYLSPKKTSAYLGDYSTRQIEPSSGFDRVTIVIAADSVDPAEVEALEPDFRAFMDEFEVGPTPEDEQIIFIIPDVPSKTVGGFHSVSGEAIVDASSPSWRFGLVHEYTHARFTFHKTSNMTWFEEAVAQYYAWKTDLEGEMWLDDDIRRKMYYERVKEQPATLSNQSTWDDQTPYTQGMLVLLALDEKIQSATDGQRDLNQVVRRMNEDGCVTYAEFESIVADVSGEEMGHWLDKHIKQPNVPEAAAPPFSAVVTLFVVSNFSPKIFLAIVGTVVLAIAFLVWWWRRR